MRLGRYFRSDLVDFLAISALLFAAMTLLLHGSEDVCLGGPAYAWGWPAPFAYGCYSAAAPVNGPLTPLFQFDPLALLSDLALVLFISLAVVAKHRLWSHDVSDGTDSFCARLRKA